MPLIIVLSVAACKKAAPDPATTISVIVNSDSSWMVNKVSAREMDNNVTELSAYMSGSSNSISLQIRDYQEGNHTYEIQNTGNGGNFNKSTAYCRTAYAYVKAYTGYIRVSGYNGNTITGSFDFTDQYNHVKGTFTAPRP
ncbi:MAG: DUF6252 family protein [Bacteroidota bacterium]